MGRSHSKAFSIAMMLCAALAATVVISVAVAQQQTPQKPRPQPPIKPYQPVAVTLPTSVNDPSFDAFRRQLGEIAVKKDKAGLARLVVTQGFFWKTDKGEKTDKNKSGIDNLTAAVQLNAKDDFGWDQLAYSAYDPTAASIASIKDVICSPAEPVFNDQEFENLLKATQTDTDDWGYPLVSGIEVRSTQVATSPVIEKLGLHFIRVLVDEITPTTSPTQLPLLHIVTPTGKTGFIPAFALAPFGNDQLCYRKDAEGWKITGFIGGD